MGTRRFALLALALAGGCGARSELVTSAPRADDAGASAGILRGVALSRRHACAWSSNALFCWGANDAQQLGYASDATCDGSDGRVACQPTPRRVPGITAPVDVALGDRHTCVLEAEGRLTCWGDATAAGTGSTARAVVPLDGVTAIAAGDAHTCALVRDGSVWCWGSNSNGQLGSTPEGRGGVTAPYWTTPRRVDAVVGAARIAAGPATSCAIDAAGSAWCWGGSLTRLHTDLGGFAMSIDASDFHPEPAPIAMPPATSIALGLDHACAVGVDGIVRCWGVDLHGATSANPASAPACPQPGGDPLPCRATPAAIAGLRARSVAPAYGATCALEPGGGVACWGAGSYGVLGDGALAPRERPAEIPGFGPASALVAIDLAACAIDARGALWCWGESDTGQLGDVAHTVIASPQRIAF